jgi:hypothetical protein
MIIQRLANRRCLATDRAPQPGDFRDDVGLSVDPQSAIVSPRRTRVKVGRPAPGRCGDSRFHVESRRPVSLTG